MEEYQVSVYATIIYSTFVEAEDEEQAKEFARIQWEQRQLDFVSEDINSVEIV